VHERTMEEAAADVEQRFSTLSRASSNAGDGLPTRAVGAHREPMPRIQVDSLYVSQMAFPGQPSPDSASPTSAVSPYPLSALPVSFPLPPTTHYPASPEDEQPVAPLPAARPRPPKEPAAGAGSDPYFGSSRTSLFLPHPNAPKPPGTSQGPMYGRRSVVLDHPPPAQPTGGSVFYAMHLARGAAFHPNGVPKKTTIYARTAVELTESPGPVPVSFSLEPPNNIPAQRAAQEAQGPPVQTSESDAPGTIGGKPIPRANFMPKAPTRRPRSRSFSAVEKPVAAPMEPIPRR
jgi:hypothetical protein